MYEKKISDVKQKLQSMTMKKRLLLSFGISLVITLSGMFVNYRAFVTEDYLKWAFDLYGGELLEQYGFGLTAMHIYSMLPDGTTTHSLHFSPVWFIVYVLVIALIIFVVLSFVHWITRKK